MKVSVYACVLLALAAFASAGAIDDPASRAKALLAKMSLSDKISMAHGTTGGYVGQTAAIPELSVPPLLLNDGPQGFRAAGHPGTSTAWPSGLTMGATWDRELMGAWGKAMGEEFVAKGANVQLGPGLCLARVPECGRNFEYLSGEDPYLGNQLVRPVVQGIQGEGVIATAKHYINNNEETNRHTISENLDERTEFEMYLPPFHGAVEAGALSIMCSYNKINYTWSCENPVTLGYLKDQLGFDGWVMSDWGATHSTVQSATAGLDQEMPSGEYFGSKLQQAVQSGQVSVDVLDDKVLRILTAMFKIGIFDHGSTGSLENNVTSVAHNQLARQLAGAAGVLLQNKDSALPLDASKAYKIAMLGSDCSATPIVAGNGSGHVVAPYIITPLQGVTNRASADSTVTYVDSSDVAGAVAAAKAADVAIVCTGTVSGEGTDRKNLSLPYEDDVLVSAVAAAQPNTVVVVANPGAVLMPWSADVKAILMMFMAGQEAGNAIADILFGDVNPSGRTPLTMPMKENQIGMSDLQWPGLPPSNPVYANYTEKLEVGYRWYVAHNATPRFPFGHGLSYTTFAYTGLSVTAGPAPAVFTVSIDITNSGSRAGAEVPQLYLGFPPESGEPPKQLKGFTKVAIDAGAKTTVTFSVSERDTSVWVPGKGWEAQHGEFAVFVGASVTDIRAIGSITV